MDNYHVIMASTWCRTIRDCAELIDSALQRMMSAPPDKAMEILGTIKTYERMIKSAERYLKYHLECQAGEIQNSNVIPIWRARK